MIPDHLDDETNRAERIVFEQLRDLDIDGWTVAFHSLNLPAHQRKRICEIDFVVLGNRGLLVLEVKAGRVTRRDGIWNAGGRRLRESPLDQAKTAMFALDTRLRDSLGTSLPGRTVFGHGVVFPDVDFDAASVEWEPAMVIDRPALTTTRLAASLDRLGRFWERKPGRRARLTDADVERYRNCLRPDFDLVPSLRHISDSVETEQVRLTERQYRALDAYGQNPRLVFEGGAGTGKTMLAAEIARRASRAGDRVLLTCRSGVLARFIRAQDGLGKVTVLPFHELEGIEGPGYDLVVVDEAQDVVNVYDLRLVDRLLVGGLSDGRWTFLLDSNNQRGLVGGYDDDAMAALVAHRPTRITLVDNCRNTVEIVAATQQRTGADLGSTSVGRGVEVEFIEGSRSEVGQAMAGVLDSLEEEQVSLDQVVLLSSHDLPGSVYSTLPDRWRRRVDVLDMARMRRPTPGRVGFARVSEFKGLESCFVVLESPGLLATRTARSLLYVGMTRARTALWVVSVPGSAAGG
jgi:hypothetical protein